MDTATFYYVAPVAASLWFLYSGTVVTLILLILVCTHDWLK